MYIFVSFFRWVENKKASDRLIEAWGNVEVWDMNEGFQILPLGILFQRLHHNNIKCFFKKITFKIFDG